MNREDQIIIEFPKNIIEFLEEGNVLTLDNKRQLMVPWVSIYERINENQFVLHNSSEKLSAKYYQDFINDIVRELVERYTTLELKK